jgi:hypothetical protein
MAEIVNRCPAGMKKAAEAALRKRAAMAYSRSSQSLPPVAQSWRLMSVMMMSTDSGEPPSTSTLTRVISSTSLR